MWPPKIFFAVSTIGPALASSGVLAGTVNSVVEQILAFRQKVGPFGTLY